MIKAKKGDRVEFTDNDETKYGVVSRGGKNKIFVILDGGTTEVKGHVSLFENSDKPLPVDDPNVMDKWSVKKYKEIEGHGDSPTFEATICLNDKPVLKAMNNGWGGPNQYRKMKNIEGNVVDQFLSDAKEWAETFGCTHTREIEDIWIHWYVHERPYGKTAKQSLTELETALSRF